MYLVCLRYCKELLYSGNALNVSFYGGAVFSTTASQYKGCWFKSLHALPCLFGFLYDHNIEIKAF